MVKANNPINALTRKTIKGKKKDGHSKEPRRTPNKAIS